MLAIYIANVSEKHVLFENPLTSDTLLPPSQTTGLTLKKQKNMEKGKLELKAELVW